MGERRPKSSARVRYLALGNSYTVGADVPTAESWPVQLARRLAEHGHVLEHPTIIAKTGWTAAELLQAATFDRSAGGFDLVSLQIGVNDQYRGADPEDYRRPFRALLAYALERAQGMAGRVAVLSIPDWGVTPHADGRDRDAIAAEIDRFNAVAREESVRRATHYVDVTAASREAGTDPTLLAPDGLHLSGRMYARWVEQALPSVLDALATKA